MPPRLRPDEVELPAIGTFDADEALLAQVSVGIARAGGKMFEGGLLECRVGRLLGARFPRVEISPWDLRLDDGTEIEVRSGTSRFSLRGPRTSISGCSSASRQEASSGMRTTSSTSSVRERRWHQLQP